MLTVLLAAAAEKAPPLIDIDATVFIQFGIFVVMAIVLYSLVFKPYFAVQDLRGKRIQGARTEAGEMQNRAQAMMSDYEAKVLRAKQKGAEQRLGLRAEGQNVEREVLAEARAVGQKALKESRERSEKQRTEARTQLLAESQSIAQQIASRILGRQV